MSTGPANGAAVRLPSVRRRPRKDVGRRLTRPELVARPSKPPSPAANTAMVPGSCTLPEPAACPRSARQPARSAASLSMATPRGPPLALASASSRAPRSIHLWQLGQKKARKLFPLASTSVALESVEAERKSPALRFEGPPATARGAGVFRVAQQGNQVTEGTVLGILVVRDMGTPLNSEEGQRDSSWKQGFQGDTLPRTGGLCPEQTPGRQCGAVGSSSEKGAGEPGDHACKDHPHGMAKELVVPRSPSDEVVRLPGESWGHVDF
ncbi:uncharacterized protein [Vicugna pacos]|uniref:Uncharacterized protein n=1 Tax=Vicugna pacos TaxID=30538 RepID=A0ABM5CZE9_VICPA